MGGRGQSNVEHNRIQGNTAATQVTSSNVRLISLTLLCLYFLGINKKSHIDFLQTVSSYYLGHKNWQQEGNLRTQKVMKHKLLQTRKGYQTEGSDAVYEADHPKDHWEKQDADSKDAPQRWRAAATLRPEGPARAERSPTYEKLKSVSPTWLPIVFE